MRCPPSLTSAGPQSFFLVSDGLFSSYQPENDQVWELNLQGTEAYPFCLQTTYGLRARSMRLFPNIRIDNKPNNNPRGFHRPTTVTSYSPDTLHVICQPSLGISMQYDFFLPTSDVLVGSITINNTEKKALNLSLELAALLIPMSEGFPTRPDYKNNFQIILGHTEEIWPVLALSGGATTAANPYPALSISLKIKPSNSENLTWALASKSNPELSFKAAQGFLAPEWQRVSHTHVMKHASETLHIQTGQPDWDKAFYLSQTIAMTHWLSEEIESTSSYFLRSRNPDQPPIFPNEGKFLDDLTTLEAAHLEQVLLPTRPQMIKKIIYNFIDRSDDNGDLFSRLNASDFVKPFREPPILAHLALMLFQREEDKAFIANVLDDLCRLTDAWFQEYDESDQSNIPTWEDPHQLQVDAGLFAFDIWEETGKGLNIQYAQSPALLAMLYRECTCIVKMANILNEASIQSKYDLRAKLLKDILAKSWQEQWNRYAYLDCDSHLCPSGERLYRGKVNKDLQLNAQFDIPQRLQLHLYANDEHTRVCILKIEGKDRRDKPISERFKPQDIFWALNIAHITTKILYTSIESISIQGMKPEDNLCIETADFSQGDITCLLPLWASADNKGAAKAILKDHLNQKAIRKAKGVPETWKEEKPLPKSLPVRVNVLWNTLIIEGLVRDGYQKEAADLFTTLMSTIVNGLRDFHGFFPTYEKTTGKPAGPRNVLAGLAPLDLFLKIAGIRLFSPNRVAIWGTCPFPWPVKVSWQGLDLEREGVSTRITFPDGSTHESDSPESVIISQRIG